MKLKNFFNWFAWLGHKNETRATIFVYGFIVVIFVFVFFPLWLISGNGISAAAVGLSVSVGSGILIGFVSSCFFSNPRKNWMIAIYDAEKIITDYSEFTADYPGYESKLRGVLIPFTRKIKDPTDLNEFAKAHKKLFEARRGLIALDAQQRNFCNQIIEAKREIREL